MTPVSRLRNRFSNSGPNNVIISRQMVGDPTHMCKFAKSHDKHRQNLWEVLNIARKPTKPMLNKPSRLTTGYATYSSINHQQPSNPHRSC